ncbi:MAG: large conductance mechanosensitive channel protein MscL [Chloroflexota bacterium]|nr:MAG: large conductance mechanosensitive channel protein MscL [Chloroflexota bacterium]
MLKGFRDFLMRGNVVDLAVAVIMGAAFGAVVTSLVEDVFTPIIGALGGQPDFSAIMLGPIRIGNFLNALLSFLIIAIVVYFVIVAPMNRLMERMRRQTETGEPPEPTKEEVLLTEIRDLLRQQRQ